MEYMVGLVMLAAIIWIVSSASYDTPATPQVKFTKENALYLLEERRKQAPGGVAKGNPGLVQCGVAKLTVPIYKRTPELHARAQELVRNVALGKKAIAAHMEARKQGVLTDDSALRTTIAGVVRDRKTLKKLQYDQPF